MKIHIFGGGTVQYVRNHLALCAPAYGTTARNLFDLLGPEVAELHLTRMADPQSKLETNEDVATRLLAVLQDSQTTAVVFNAALCDFSGQIGGIPSGKYAERLSSREGAQSMRLTPSPKLLEQVKVLRPDVRVVGFKTTADACEEEQLRLARRQQMETNVDYVFANDTVTRHNVLVHANGAFAADREVLLSELARYLRNFV